MEWSDAKFLSKVFFYRYFFRGGSWKDWFEDPLVKGVLIPGRSPMTRECRLLNSGSETLKKVKEAMRSGKL